MNKFLWAILNKAISLGANLQRRGLATGMNCTRCQEQETEMHCFFTCHFAMEVWKLIPLHRTVHLAVGATFKDAIVSFRKHICLPPSGISLNILPWILWEIWTSRNALIFEGRRYSPEETALKGIKLAKEWSTSQAEFTKKGILPSEKQVWHAPRPPSSSDNTKTTCKTDAAWSKEKLLAGLGWIFSGSTLRTPITGSAVEASVKSPLVAEAVAIRAALCMATNLEITSIEVLSDNQTLVRAISGITQAKEIIGIVKDIRSIASEFASSSFSFIPRSQNSTADALAKEALRFSSVYLL
ncbi:uncharacterized protein LOC130501385 [Raphanus sativus]|uniref:Uncharacterized protein LOC130501385 n=1 Tax=Raphanus sativus TaxID=3726 RepID=A0A9W3CKW7_RAPSA|nr:uncharacterized protein LOC130501385 [Raphanus sativus]